MGVLLWLNHLLLLGIDTKKIFITTLVTGIILLFIYSVAGYIETQYYY